MNSTCIDTLDDTDVMEMQDELTPEQRVHWETSIESDLREIAEGKPQKYISGDEFWSELREAVMRQYEKV
ncbi:MAG: hypothetical protein J6X62_07520 [Bacteroidales bacterium]|nr:hypothetical protein [Bacteroidales bacterium]